jgi:DNA-binding NarL/FixJ family response regulator
LSQFSTPVYALALFEQGADRRAYLLKDRVHNRAELTSAIRAVAEGGSLIDPKVVEELAKSRARAQNNPLRELTAREYEVLTEIAQGKSNLAIAQSLYLSKRAIEKHINMIFIKLGLADAEDVSRRVKAVLLMLAESDAADRT